MATKYKYTRVNKYMGDDDYSWTIFNKYTGQPLVTGLHKSEKKYYRDKFENELFEYYKGM